MQDKTAAPKRRRFGTSNRVAAVGGTSGALVTYGASIVSAKYNVPLEVAAIVVGGVFGFAMRWAAKLLPRD